MIRTTVFLSAAQHERLKVLAEKEDVKSSEIFRRAIDIYITLYGLFGSKKLERVTQILGDLTE